MSGGTLFVVATPLGNLSDLTQRAISVLAAADVVAAEDTRRARTLLMTAGAHPRVISFHAHSPPGRFRQVLNLLEEGKAVALVTDAGTPTVSDPGAELVRQARAEGHLVTVVPGPSAVAAALSISGMPADRYIFLGFLPRRGGERGRMLEQAATSPLTVVFFEAANRLVALLDELAGRCEAERQVAVARELTKIHEELKAGTLTEVAAHYREHPPRGEVTVVLSAAEEAEAAPPVNVEERARALLGEGLSRRDVAAQLADELGVPRNEAYRMVNAL